MIDVWPSTLGENISVARAGTMLGEPYRSVVEQHLGECAPPRDIAIALGRAPGTVAEGLATVPETSPATFQIEHPMGTMDVRVQFENGADGFQFISAGDTRTARLLARGEALVPRSIWAG